MLENSTIKNMGILSVVIKYTAICSVPIFIVITSIKQIREHIVKYKEDCMWHKKHNCVVMYSKGEGMSGWPPYEGRLRLTAANLVKYYEPITFFIDTAKTSIDIAVMNININQIFQALKSALARGVKVRLILDYHFMKRDNNVQNLQKLGAQISHYIHYDSDTIMHYKFAIKDFDGENGYILSGSMNWTMASVMENYEDIVFSSNKAIVKELHRYFENAWEYLKKQRVMDESMELIENENL